MEQPCFVWAREEHGHDPRGRSTQGASAPRVDEKLRTNTTSVSILTPTFNHARFIEQCLSSVAAQTHRHWQQLVIDDGSTDGTYEIARRWTDPRLRVDRQPHVGIFGLAATYNAALHATDGEFVAILEGDDYWRPDKLEMLLPAFRDPDVVLAYGRTTVVIGSRPSQRSIPDDSFARRFGAQALSNDPVGAAAIAMLDTGIPFTFPCSVVIRRSALEAIGGFKTAEGLGAVDYPTFLALAMAGRFAYVDRTVAYWRRHSDSGSWSTHLQAMHAVVEHSRTFVNEHGAGLGIGVDRTLALERVWQRRLQRAAFNSGRYLLLQSRWREAREQFIRALGSSYPPIAASGAVGYVASLAHRDLEGILAALGRVSFPSQRMAKR